MKLTTVNVPEGLVETLDRLVKEGRYANRAEAIRCAIKSLIDEHRNLKRVDFRGTSDRVVKDQEGTERQE